MEDYLLELNLGKNDYRVHCKPTHIVTIKDIIKLIKKVEEHFKWIGIGGHPLRFKKIADLINEIGLSTSNYYIVDSCNQFSNFGLEELAKYKNINLIAEIEKAKDINWLKKNKGSFSAVAVSVYTLFKNPKLESKLLLEKLTYDVEDVTWVIKDKEFVNYRSRKKTSSKVCGIVNSRLISSDTKGNFYPCVALCNSKYLLGNIYTNSVKEIIHNYNKFKQLITCPNCCQARSLASSNLMNQDYLCQTK
ncbi:hypothetical protein L6255_00280 [Candidatus Parcubacteria bacterium]|nr:SPASM domain-containing protein [Patescibacteria group bacterium]MCG2688877.1 hypothetical protein [Candidatus Parcubacteria bacterium]